MKSSISILTIAVLLAVVLAGASIPLVMTPQIAHADSNQIHINQLANHGSDIACVCDQDQVINK